MPKAPTTMPKTKHYSFDTDEFLYISEHRGQMEWHDSLIRRYIAAKVLKRLGVDVKSKIIRVSHDGAGIDVTDNPNPVESEVPPKAPLAESPKTPVTAPAPKPGQ